MTFLKDNVWNNAKRIAKLNGMADNWIEIVDYYNSTGGCHVMVYAVVEDVKYRILRIDDKENVLLSKRNGELVTMSYDSIISSNKQFFYNESELQMHTVTLPTTCSIQGATDVKIYS